MSSLAEPGPVSPHAAAGANGPADDLDIIYEDQFFLVVVKPAGMVVHPGYHHADGTLWNLLAALFAARGLRDHPRLLHRLDRDTSGLLCVPKQLSAHRRLERLLQAGQFEKRYLALVRGRLDAGGRVEAPLGRDDVDRRRVCVRADGQRAVTHFAVLRRLPAHTLLRVDLETGRMHQIRAHLAYLGHPVEGDPIYGGVPGVCPRLFLHADRLAFPHPVTRERVVCHAPLPADLRLLVHRLGALPG